MKAKSTTCAIAITFLVVALCLAWLGFSEARAVRGELTFLGRERSSLQVRSGQAKDKIDACRQDRERLEATLRKSRPAKPAPASGVSLIARNPKLLDLYLKSYRAGLAQRYGPFYMMMNLSSTQIDQFEDSLAKHEEGKMDLMATSAAEGLGSADSAIATLGKQQDDELRAEETALLGEEGFKELQQFNRQQAAQWIVTGTAAYALESDPVSNAQAGQLMQILSNTDASFQQGKPFDPKTVDWDSALAQATTILSPAQMSALRVEVQITNAQKLLSTYFKQFKQQSGK